MTVKTKPPLNFTGMNDSSEEVVSARFYQPLICQ